MQRDNAAACQAQARGSKRLRRRRFSSSRSAGPRFDLRPSSGTSGDGPSTCLYLYMLWREITTPAQDIL